MHSEWKAVDGQQIQQIFTGRYSVTRYIGALWHLDHH